MQERVVKIDGEGLEKLVIKQGGEERVIDLNEFLKIDENNIEQEMRENPSQYAYYASVLSWYEKLRDELSNKLEELEYKKELVIRKRIAEVGDKIREAEVRALVETDKEVLELRNKVLEVKYVVKRLTALVRGIEKKGDRLSQIYARLTRQMRDVGLL